MTHIPIPAGYRAVPLGDKVGIFGWPVALIVRNDQKSLPELVEIARLPDMRGFLGCVLDGYGQPKTWLEVWVQNLEDFQNSELNETQASSESLDQRWRALWKTARAVHPTAVALEIPENISLPLYLDPKECKVVRPSCPGGSEWVLCRDDQKLENAKLPKYSESTSRYLIAHRGTDKTPLFVATDSRAILNEIATERTAELGFDPSWVPINPQGGFLGARVYSPMDFGDLADLLSGATISEVTARKSNCEAMLISSFLSQGFQSGRRHGLLLAGNNPWELFYLKLRLFLQASQALHAQLRETQCPLLNLDPGSFGVFPNAEGDLPWAWTTACQLVRPGRAFPFKIPETSEVRFVAVGESGAGAFCAAGLSPQRSLGVTIRLGRVVVDEARRASLEGTIWVSAPVPVGSSDIIRFQLSHQVITGEFYGCPSLTNHAFTREVAFRTWSRVLEPQEIGQLKRLEGGRIERCWCEFIPALSSPYDFNSLAIMGARTLLAHEKNPLSTVVEELERLGRTAGEQLPAPATLEQTILILEKLMASNTFPACLRSNQLLGGLPDSPQDPDWLPPRLWAEVIAVLLRLLPGLGPVSQCTDYGAAPVGALHTPLDEPLEALEDLAARARSLVFSDWNANREIREILATVRESL